MSNGPTLSRAIALVAQADAVAEIYERHAALYEQTADAAREVMRAVEKFRLCEQAARKAAAEAHATSLDIQNVKRELAAVIAAAQETRRARQAQQQPAMQAHG